MKKNQMIVRDNSNFYLQRIGKNDNNIKIWKKILIIGHGTILLIHKIGINLLGDFANV